MEQQGAVSSTTRASKGAIVTQRAQTQDDRAVNGSKLRTTLSIWFGSCSIDSMSIAGII